MATKGEDVASADGAMGQRGGQLYNGRIGQCHHHAIGRWPLEQYDDETLAQYQDGTTGNRDHGYWDTGPRTSAQARKRASAQARKHASAQARKRARLQKCKRASVQERKPTSTQTRKHASSPARHATRQRAGTQATKRTVKTSARPGLVICDSGSSFKLIVPCGILRSTNTWAEHASTKQKTIMAEGTDPRQKAPAALGVGGGLGVRKFLRGGTQARQCGF